MTKKELKSWIESQQIQGNSVPWVICGGGSGWIEPSEDITEYFGEDYLEEVVPVVKRFYDEEEREYIKSCFKFVGEELAEMEIFCVQHDTGWNQENFDMYVCVWED